MSGPPAIRMPGLDKVRQYLLQLQESGISQTKIAKECKRSQGYLSKFLAGRQENPGYEFVKCIVDIYNREILKEQSETSLKTAGDIAIRNLMSVEPSDYIEFARSILVKNDFSQLPVIKDERVVGCITDKDLVKLGQDAKQRFVHQLMGKPFPVIKADADIDVVRQYLVALDSSAVLVDYGRPTNLGIITKHDLMREDQRQKQQQELKKNKMIQSGGQPHAVPD